MKHLSLGLGMVVVLSPLSMQAEPAASSKTLTRVVVTDVSTKVSDAPVRVDSLRALVYAPASMRNLYYISSEVFTGSHVPAIIRRYHRKFELANGAALAHGGQDALVLKTHNSGDVKSTLLKADPGFSGFN